MTTLVTIPKNRSIEQLRIWHALPTPRPWFGEIETLSWNPDLGERQYNKQHDSHHVFFRKTKGLNTGQQSKFETQFRVVSQDREFDPQASKTRWSDITTQAKPSGNSQLEAFAEVLRKAKTPALAVLMATKKINEQLKYDSNVPYRPTNLEKTMTNKKGHCGHYFALLKASCEELGIEIRVARGLNLYCPDGVSSAIQKVRADYTNIHTWAEVHLPKDGWIEVEPTESDTPFKLKSHLIQNNPWFQNYAFWFREDGKEKLHKWTHAGGRYKSDFDLSHTIAYTVKPLEKQKRSKQR